MLLSMVVFLQPEINLILEIYIIALTSLPLLSLLVYVVLAGSTVIVAKLEQLANGLLPILVTLLGMAILVKPLQPRKAPSPIVVTLLGIVILVKYRQHQNALVPIVVNPFGSVMFVSPKQPENAELAIVVTVFGIVVFLQPEINVVLEIFIIALTSLPLLSLLVYAVLAGSTVIVSNLKQPSNGLIPILVTLLGMVILVKRLQS